MRTKFLPLAILIAVSITLTGCASKKSATTDSSPKTDSAIVASGGEVGEDEVIEMDSDAVSLSTVTYSGSSATGADLFNTAVNSKDEDGCKKLSKKEDREMCLDKILYSSALAQLKIELCEDISDTETKKLCVADVSEQVLARVSNLAGCERIKDAPLKKKCEDRMGILENPKSESECAKLEEPKLRMECVDRVAIAAVRKGTVTDQNACSKIKNPVLSRECRFRASKAKEVETKKQSYSSERNGEVKVACAAETGMNADYCRKEKALEIAAKTGDASVCSAVENQSMRDSCVKDVQAQSAKTFFDQAMTAKDPAICSKIADGAYAARCKEIVGKSR